MRINVQVIEAYEKLQNELETIIKSYGINVSNLCERTGMSRSTFDRKVKNKTFQVDELKKVAQAIND